jgi:hypothetical protein
MRWLTWALRLSQISTIGVGAVALFDRERRSARPARVKNRRAATASRRADTSTSMTWPYWSIARYTYRQTPLALT